MPSAGSDGAADLTIARDDSAHGRRTAASLWARATARRDGRPGPDPIEAKLPGIRHRLSTGAGSLHIAHLRGEPAGFALVVMGDAVLELVYLAVAPEAWGAGIGRHLLAYVDELGRAAGVGGMELWVIDDNERAIRLYARCGWKPTGDLKISAGRPERRLVKEPTRGPV